MLFTKEKFYEYVLDFYGSGPDVIYPMNATLEQVKQATEILIERFGMDNIDFDSVDRERVRDILIERFGLIFPDPEG